MEGPASPVAGSAPVLAASRLGKRYDLGPSRVRRLLAHLRTREADVDGTSSHWAVQDVSVRLGAGESLGLIGPNGSGKSTLLRLLAGTAVPTTGQVHVGAPLASLLDLGAGIQVLETGRQNAEALLVLQAGLSRREAKERVREVEEFAGIGDFFDRPVRTYSDGMRLRLGFAAITLLEPELLITDEIIVVGDEAFQRKCARWLDRFLARGGTLVLCSHDLAQVQSLCARALWLDGGRPIELGEARDVIRHYREAIGAGAAGGEEGGGASGTRHDVGELAGLPFEVVDLHLRDPEGREVRALEPEATVVVEADVLAPAGVPQIFIGITRADLTPVYGVASDMEGAEPQPLGGGRFRYRLRFERLPLTAGRYRLRAHALDETGTRLYDTVEIPFSVAGEDGEDGLVRLRTEWHPDRP